MNGNSSKVNNDSKIIEIIASITKKLGILLFDQTFSGKWKLKEEQEIIKIVDDKYKDVHDNLCKTIETLHKTRQYSKVNIIMKECHTTLHMLDEIVNLTKKYFASNKTKMVIIEHFSTENV